MSEKRRDSLGRILRDNERQRPDGSYEFRYIDSFGDKRSVYSWKLVNTDKTPSGKKERPSLRDQEKLIQKDLNDGIASNGGKITVVQLCEKYILTKTGVKPTTEANYKTVLNHLRKSSFGKKRIDTVKVSDAKIFLIELQKKDEKSYSTVHNIRGVLRPAFQMAMEDDYIRKNPFDWPTASVLYNDSHKRDALSPKDEKRLLKFVEGDEYFSKYYDAIYILINTGLRISELCGLTLADLDMKERRLSIDHQLQRKQDGTLYIQSTKTNAGTRVLPIKDDVYATFQHVLDQRNAPEIEPMVDGYTGFIWLNHDAKKGLRPMVAMDFEHIFQRIVKKFNSIYRLQMPPVTPHVCRHTYCSKMAKSGMNPKILQYLMGHSDIGVTLNTYTHLGLEAAEEEITRMNDKKDGKVREKLSIVG